MGLPATKILKWTVPHHCLVTVSVAMHKSHLGLRIQGRPFPGHHLKLTRHVSYACGGVVDSIQPRISQREEDNLEALGEFIATAAVGHLTEKPLGENRRHAGEVVSSVGDTRHLRACSVYGLLYSIGVGHHMNHGEIQHLHCRTSFCVHTVRKCNLKVILTFCEAELEEVSGQEREQQNQKTTSDPKSSPNRDWYFANTLLLTSLLLRIQKTSVTSWQHVNWFSLNSTTSV